MDDEYCNILNSTVSTVNTPTSHVHWRLLTNRNPTYLTTYCLTTIYEQHCYFLSWSPDFDSQVTKVVQSCFVKWDTHWSNGSNGSLLCDQLSGPQLIQNTAARNLTLSKRSIHITPTIAIFNGTHILTACFWSLECSGSCLCLWSADLLWASTLLGSL